MVYDKSTGANFDSILPQGAPKNVFRSFLSSLWSSKPQTSVAFEQKVFLQVGSISDVSFLADLKDLTCYGGSVVEGAVQELHKAISCYFNEKISKDLHELVSNVKYAQQKVHNSQINIFFANQNIQEYANLRASIVEELCSASVATSSKGFVRFLLCFH